MPLRTILFLIGLVTASGGAVFAPLIGVLGYVAHYNLGAERQWWFAPISGWGLRCSLTLVVATAIGMALHWKGLRYGKTFFHSQEKLLLVFIAIIWISTFLGEPTEGAYTMVDHPSVKMTKVAIFALMLTHIVTTVRRLDLLLWVLTAGALVLGLQAYWTPYSEFSRGRIETIGGPDFQDSNQLAAFLVAMLSIIGFQFLRSGWTRKALCGLSGAFAANAMILTRSRGAVIGLAAGAVAGLLLAPKGHRAKIAGALAVAVIGFLYLSDAMFWQRASTINSSESDRDRSAQARVEIWEGGIRMIKDNPLGVGAGNFIQTIGRYAPEHAGRDAHNTFVRCAAELGLQGLAVYSALIVNALVLLARSIRWAKGSSHPQRDSVLSFSCALLVGLLAYLACSLFGSFVYVELLWWLLVLPVCLSRVIENLQAERQLVSVKAGALAGRTKRASRPQPWQTAKAGPEGR
jgi:putative inorganic carbon (HCO3(-)) transporter